MEFLASKSASDVPFDDKQRELEEFQDIMSDSNRIKGDYYYDQQFMNSVFEILNSSELEIFNSRLDNLISGMDQSETFSWNRIELQSRCKSIYQLMTKSKFQSAHRANFQERYAQMLDVDQSVISHLQDNAFNSNHQLTYGRSNDVSSKKNKVAVIKELFPVKKVKFNSNNDGRSSFQDEEQRKLIANDLQVYLLSLKKTKQNIEARTLQSTTSSQRSPSMDVSSQIDYGFFAQKNAIPLEPPVGKSYQKKLLENRSFLIEDLKKDDKGESLEKSLSSIYDVNEQDEFVKQRNRQHLEILVNGYDEQGRTLLHHAIFLNSPDAISVLSKYNANMNKPTLDILTAGYVFSPLYFAQQVNYKTEIKLPMIEQLLKHGAFPKFHKYFTFILKKALKHKNQDLLLEVIKAGGLIDHELSLSTEIEAFLRDVLKKVANPLIYRLIINSHVVKSEGRLIDSNESLEQVISKMASPGELRLFLIESFYQLTGAIEIQKSILHNQGFFDELVQSLELVHDHLQPFLKGKSLLTLCLPKYIVENSKFTDQVGKHKSTISRDRLIDMRSMQTLYHWKKALLENQAFKPI